MGDLGMADSDEVMVKILGLIEGTEVEKEVLKIPRDQAREQINDLILDHLYVWRTRGIWSPIVIYDGGELKLERPEDAIALVGEERYESTMRYYDRLRKAFDEEVEKIRRIFDRVAG